ncbi:sodium/hydrogen exchanger [Sulfurimonas gotlandica GD1]|jgi:Kef-type K+ transport system membrane component KefB|uniref:Sodium/hydrogen exchanger n=1 Tax=Sulfurimonas gotlandica (strain DSM 19862 / JCM 16533 / GD1) TaxID=929558 RepID=B6BI26_SULGG|nr:cation:proton antiporter [Sulfurimonas gotlandica]EDZ62955.1 putative Na+/H+ antiporter [Sulfurimonas gotlandica GD1]EHP30178.1 sodium/hydrogen exchanger [Sulfurimonas gotlandica GD1]
MEMLFNIGIIFVLGSIVGWFSPGFGIPRVVGYLLLGLVIGPGLLGIIPAEFVKHSHLIIDISLSVIAVLVGATLKFSSLDGHHKEVIYITLYQAIGTFIIVAIGFILFANVLKFETTQIVLMSLLLAGIATATAPATPLAIVNELHAKGIFTSTLLAIVALDDVISLMLFSLALTIGTSLVGSGVLEWINIVDATKVLFFSILFGTIAGLINTLLERVFVDSKTMETIATLGLIFLVYSMSNFYALEPLLSAMTMGIVMANTSHNFDLIQEEIDKHLANIIFMLFFIISAMYLQLEALLSVPLIIALYTILRFVGKVSGSYLGAVVSNSSDAIKKYMGIALFPQAGVAIGLALSIQNHPQLESIAPLILNVIIATTFIHELLGPFMTKYALQKSGECTREELKDSLKKRRRFSD